MIEKEIRGFIDKNTFTSTRERFANFLGQPTESRRLSLVIADYDNLTLETKIRITNGKAEVVQKVGDFTATDREEITIKLDGLSAGQLVDLFITYKNFLNDKPNPMLTLIQHENYIFRNDRVEVKLFRQFGNDEFFAFEVEALVEMEDAELDKFCADNGLVVDPNYNNYESIQKRNSKVNIDLRSIETNMLESIVRSYLK